MTPKILTTALVACTLLGTVAQADVTIIQSGPMPSHMSSTFMAPNIAQMRGSGYDMALGFIRDMAATRMPGFDMNAALAPSVILADPTMAPVFDPIAFSGHWSLVEIYDIDASPLTYSNELLARAEFGIETQGRFTASAGCNAIFGHMAQTGSLVETGEIMATLMACDEPDMSLERALIHSLSSASLFAHGHNRLVFLDRNGLPLARFAARVD